MTKQQKQLFSECVMSLLGMTSVITFIQFKNDQLQMWCPLMAISFCLLSPLVMKKVLGPDSIRKTQWKEEGFSNFRSWFLKSDSSSATFSRQLIQVVVILNVGFWLLVSILLFAAR